MRKLRFIILISAMSVLFANCKSQQKEERKVAPDVSTYKIDYRLHDIWALEELAGKKIKPQDFKNGVPNLEIYAAEARFSGFAGCNQMEGKLVSEKGLLRFTDIFTSEMMCGDYELEKILLKALQSTTRYELKENKLYLFNLEETKAVFRKVD